MENIDEMRGKIKFYEFYIDYIEKQLTDLENQLKDVESYQKEKLNTVNNTKKEEVINALEYLKSKEVKTKQDQISIYTLEVVLKGLK
jgi:hypothetical protein